MKIPLILSSFRTIRIAFAVMATLLAVFCPGRVSASSFVGEAAGIKIVERPGGHQIATGNLKAIPADSLAGEVLAGLRGAPGLAAAQEDPASQVAIEFEGDRVYRVTVTVPGSAPSTVLNSYGGMTLQDALKGEAGSLLGTPRDGAPNIQSDHDHVDARTVAVATPSAKPPSAPVPGDAEESSLPAKFLVGEKPSVEPFVRVLAGVKSSEVTLNAADLLPAARAQMARDLPGNPLAARIGSGAARAGENVRVTVASRDGAFVILSVVPAAGVPPARESSPAPSRGPVDGDNGNSGLPAAVTPPLPLPFATETASSEELGPATSARYFNSGDIPSVSGTGADGKSGQRGLPAAYLAALSNARAAIANIPPSTKMSFQAAVNTSRVRLNDLSAAYIRLEGEGGFQKNADSNVRREKIFGSTSGTGSIAAMNRSPSPETILRAFRDIAAMNQYRR